MRIGFDAHVLDGRDQGTKTLMLRLIDQVARRHPEHDILVYSEAPHTELDFTLANLHFRQVPHHGSTRHLIHTLPKAKKADRLDTMVFNFISSPTMADASVMMHDILAQTNPRFFPLSFVLRCWLFYGLSSLRARHLFTISDYSRNEIRSIYPWTRNKPIVVLPIGASFTKDVYFASDDVAPLPRGLGAQVRYVLVVGRIEPRKNVQMAINAFRAGAPSDVRLVIVGRREPGIAIETGDDPRIVELTGISDVELATLYRGAALFLYPSAAEGFGLPLLDAVLFGVPTIASSRTSMEEVGSGAVTFFDPTAADAEHWLGGRISAHFRSKPVPPPTDDIRREKADRYSWSNAADELIRGLVGT